jgi:hypothetical protein
MANVGTSIGGFLKGIGGGIRDAFSGFGNIASDLAPVATAGLDIFGAVRSLNQPAIQPQQGRVRTMGSSAMPGGAPVSMISTTGIGVGPTGAGLSGLVPALQGVGQALTPGGSPGPVGIISPVPTRGGLRLPRLVNVPNPTDPSKLETYVRAPRPRYRVSISGPRRRCRGGR